MGTRTGTKRKVDQSWFNAKSVEYETPDSIYEPLDREFGFTLDVASTHENAKCANHYTADDDGLEREWSGVCWMNPPYGRVMQRWVRKAHREYLRGCTVVALLPARTNTGWWHECVQDIAAVRFIRGEVAFKGFDRGLWMPMCVAIWQPKGPFKGGRAMFRVVAQVNSGDPCPKKEDRAWSRMVKECPTLEECILFLIENQAEGFKVTKHLKGGEEAVASEMAVAYPSCRGRGDHEED